MLAVTETLSEKIQRVRQELAGMRGVLVAYSGGVDSSLMLKLAHDELRDQALGALALSASLPQQEKLEALEVADTIGAKVILLTTEEVTDPNYAANAPNRCFHCKDHVYGTLKSEADRRAIPYVLDGMNAEDTLDIRPGRAAAKKHQVRSLLHEYGFSKQEVRDAARALGLPNWDKPAAACLASRIPYGVRVTQDLLARIEAGEAYLKSLGFAECRLRHHGDVARIEVPESLLLEALQKRETLSGGLKALGWLYITLDLEALRHGSMNAPLRPTVAASA